MEILNDCDRKNIQSPTFVISHPLSVPHIPEMNFPILLGEIWNLKSSVLVINQYTAGVNLSAFPSTATA